ncbi:MAG: hypothetical protein H6881_07945 [Rhodobiaceae bacterium]|nr:hypothetical protein [Hoeflea sp.]MCC0051793.1 hypothetical protein [Rhodobiaceae bacterium]
MRHLAVSEKGAADTERDEKDLIAIRGEFKMPAFGSGKYFYDRFGDGRLLPPRANCPRAVPGRGVFPAKQADAAADGPRPRFETGRNLDTGAANVN